METCRPSLDRSGVAIMASVSPAIRLPPSVSSYEQTMPLSRHVTHEGLSPEHLHLATRQPLHERYVLLPLLALAWDADGRL